MNKGKIELNKFERGTGTDRHVFEYLAEHNNGKTSVEQTLTITSADGLFEPTWIATVALDDFPPQKTPEDAANKLADWLERLASAIKTGEYQPFVNIQFKDIIDTNTPTKE
jgi:hypothetical protein